MDAKHLRASLALSALAVLVTACGGSDDDDDGGMMSTPVQYEVQTTNLTSGQPLSPLAVVLHESGYQAFTLGEAASTDLERLAEGGDNSALLSTADGMATVTATASGMAAIGPGSNETVQVEAPEGSAGAQHLSLVTMLVNTNDAIAALDGVNLSGLAVGESMTVTGISYDTGTEANTETADTMPGPAAAGGVQEGFNTARNDLRDEVYVHAGVVTADDGLSSSVLDAAHRWDNPVIRVSITRTQ